MGNKNESTREQARQILKDGILDMSVARLKQLSEFGLTGNISLSSKLYNVKSAFDYIEYDEESNAITFMNMESRAGNNAVLLMVDSIVEISGCEDSIYPDKYLNINIKLKDDTAIVIRVLY